MPLFAIEWDDAPARPEHSRRRESPTRDTARPPLVVVASHPRRTYVAGADRRHRWSRLYPSVALVLAGGALLAGLLTGWPGSG
jgi:hypothetical protein